MRRIRKISTAAALAVALGAVAGGAIAMPAAQAQTIKTNVHHNTPQIGMNLYVQDNYSLADTKTFGERDLKYIADTLKLKEVSIDWDYDVPSQRSDVVKDFARTPSIADLWLLTNIAKSYGLRVEYRALFAIGGKDSRSTSIEPRHLGAWLKSLLATEKPALTLAGALVVKEFAVGTEMASVDQSSQWDNFFKKAENYYQGILSYASWGGRGGSGGFFGKNRVLLPVDKPGASAYPPIDLSDNASVDTLTAAWESFLTKHTDAAVLKRTAIDEMGIPAVANSYPDPWQWDNLSGPADPTVQANWYAAACRAVKAEHMRGLYFWSMPLAEDPAKPYDSLVGWEGRPESIAAIKSCAS